MTIGADGSEKRTELCPRLIDYVVLCGIRHPGQKKTPLSQANAAAAGSSSSDQYHSLSLDVPDNGQVTAPVPLHVVQNPELLRRYPSNDHKVKDKYYDDFLISKKFTEKQKTIY